MSRWRSAVFLVSTAIIPVFPAESDEALSYQPISERRVGFSPLSGSRLGPEHRYLAEVLPKLVREKLGKIKGVVYLEAESPVDLLPREISTNSNLSLLIWGKIEPVGERLLIEIYAFDSSEGGEVWSFIDSGDPDVLLSAVNPIADGLASLMIGQSWARLVVDVNPHDSTVRLDGDLIGVGRTELRYTPPRRAKLSVSRSGYLDAVQWVELMPGQEKHVFMGLVPLNIGTVLLDSRPGGAAIYVASSYAGVTPLKLPRPEVNTPIEILLDGYSRKKTRLGPSSPDELTITLMPADYNAIALQEQERDLFYEELGWFAASLLPPLVLTALATDLVYRDASLQAEAGLISWQPVTIGVTISAVVSAGYAVYRLLSTIGAMIDYTAASDRPTG